ncbi:MAG: hypothetical protein KatS3mg105_3498 [Gemmatales bacterium]|nr:MAG: hypothetical protein KatS3mg105_3498 [Gemmatales bacterium]
MFISIEARRVASEIQAHVDKCGGNYSGWYASDPRARLFNDHNVDEDNGAWIFRDAGTNAVAREVEAHLHSLGCKGSGGGGDGTTRYVYAYRITRATRE